jgi:hypothetical protein
LQALRATPIRLGAKLTERRIRVHAAVLAICIWALYGIDLATPGLRDRVGQVKGGDFVHFYVLGTLAREGRGSILYDMDAQTALIPRLISDSAGLQYVPLYGPQVSMFFATFARLSYAQALVLWWLLTAVMYATSIYLIWRACPRLRSHGKTVLLVAIAYPGFFTLIAWGQSSAPALLAFVLAYLALRSGHRVTAGLALGLLAFKPALAVAAGIVFLWTGEWLMLAGAFISAAAQIAIAWEHYGTGVMEAYVATLRNVPSQFALIEPKVYMVHTLRAFWALLVPIGWFAPILYVLSAVMVLAIAILVWRRSRSLELRYSSLLIATVLVAPHLTVYDLVVLAPALLLLAEWILEKPERQVDSMLPALLYACFVLPLFGPLTRWTHIQLSVIVFAGLLWWMWSYVKRSSRPIAPAS